MPELPEVQTVVHDLCKQGIIGAQIVKTALFWLKTIAEPSVEKFSEQIIGQEIIQIERRGKYICMQLGSCTLLLHLRMSGRLLLENVESPPTSHERARFFLHDGRILKFLDQRKFGRIYLLKDPAKRLDLLGIDPTLSTFTTAYFQRLLARKMKIKSLLLNQTILSGIGNIYADEALWEAKIHPETVAQNLQQHEIAALHKAIQTILHSAIVAQGTSLGQNPANFHSVTNERGNYVQQLKVYHQTGSPCARCQTRITRIKLNGRSTHLCETCQTKAKIYSNSSRRSGAGQESFVGK